VRPPGWRASRVGRSLRLRSPDRSALLAVASPRGTRSSARVLRQALRGLQKTYRDVKVSAGPQRQVAGLPTASAVVRTANKSGAKLRVLVAAPQGRRRAWVVELFAVEGAGQGLVDARAALDSLRLRG